MKVKELGEFGLIDTIKRMVGSCRGVVRGIGDDCAVLPYNSREFLLLTCDMLVEGVDFNRRHSLYLVGKKSLGCCVSDIAACGGTPAYAQVSLGLYANMPVSRVKQLYRGIIRQAERFKVKVVGGDISQSDKLVIDISLTGLVKKNEFIARSGAKKGDIIFVTGRLGGSIYGRHLRFTPRLKEAQYLVKHYRINSMIDISDGLIQDLRHILQESGKGAILYKELIPVSHAAQNFNQALFMGEDFQLLFTLPVAEAKRLISSPEKNGFSLIGEITEKSQGLVLLDRQAREIKIRSSGFQHFK
ncbi:thiamine-monophosphate kinase [Candidatus Omnitrophota bacterium]